MESPRSVASSDVMMTPELKEEARLARRFFTQLERLGTVMTGYPAGHPVVEQSAEKTRNALYAYFELNDRLTVQVDPHALVLSGTDEAVWETEPPKDICFALSRDGIYLIHLLAGVDNAELRRFVEILNRLVDQRDMMTDAVTELFEGNFRYIAYEAIDESLAALAGLDVDIRDRDTEDEREMIEELFDEAFSRAEEELDQSNMQTFGQDDFEIRMQIRAERQRKIEVGSREFLSLSEEAQRHLDDLKRGFTEHNELEHREGEILSAILGARPKPKLRHESVKQIGEVMGTLLETDEPWEALAFLKLIHEWRDKFGPEVADELKAVVKECFTEPRIQAMLKQVATADRDARRAILQMFNALHLERATKGLVGLLTWNLDDEVREDVVRYARERMRYGLDFLEDALAEATDGSDIDPLIELTIEAMPKARPILAGLLAADVEPRVKARALDALSGTWDDPREVRDHVVPLLKSSSPDLQLAAIRTVCEATPQHVVRVVGPLLESGLRDRPEEQVRELVTLFVKHGRAQAASTIEEFVHKRGVVSEEDRELAVVIIRALIQSPMPPIIKMLEDVAGDWLVPKRIRKNAGEVADILQAG